MRFPLLLLSLQVRMTLRLTDDQALLRQSVREFAEQELRPHVMEWDEAQYFPRELLPRRAELGLMGMQFPDEYGGAGLSAVDYCICVEELARVDPSICLSVAAHNGLGASHIFMFGTEEQKRTWLVPLATGQQLAAWALSGRPGVSGLHAAALSTANCDSVTGRPRLSSQARASLPSDVRI
jgi:alkylation response protein AidB-like acyl-CoA dehydrogenase